MILLRNGASGWHLYEDLKQPNKFRMEVVVPSWKQHLLQRERMTKTEKDVLLKLLTLRTDLNPPEEWISLSVDKEVLNKRVNLGDCRRVTSINKLRRCSDGPREDLKLDEFLREFRNRIHYGLSS